MELFFRFYDYMSEVNKMIDQETLKRFDQLYYKTYQDALNYTICNCSNMEDVKDIIQIAYLNIFEYLKKGSKIENEKYFVLGIIKNKIKDHYRFQYKQKLHTVIFHEENNIDWIPSEEDIVNMALIKEDMSVIWNYLKKKKMIVCQIFYLYYYNNFSIKEISLTLNMTESNVKHHLYRTLKELNIILESGEQNGAKNIQENI